LIKLIKSFLIFLSIIALKQLTKTVNPTNIKKVFIGLWVALTLKGLKQNKYLDHLKGAALDWKKVHILPS
jgi:hypothetical protein